LSIFDKQSRIIVKLLTKTTGVCFIWSRTHMAPKSVINLWAEIDGKAGWKNVLRWVGYACNEGSVRRLVIKCFAGRSRRTLYRIKIYDKTATGSGS